MRSCACFWGMYQQTLHTAGETLWHSLPEACRCSCTAVATAPTFLLVLALPPWAKAHAMLMVLTFVPCRTAYFISSHEGSLPQQGCAELLDCGLLTQAPCLQSLEQVR
jgi:hypothetical protein